MHYKYYYNHLVSLAGGVELLSKKGRDLVMYNGRDPYKAIRVTAPCKRSTNP